MVETQVLVTRISAHINNYRERNLRVGVDTVRLIEDHIVLEGVGTASGDFKGFQGHGGCYHCIGRRHRGNDVFNNALKDQK